MSSTDSKGRTRYCVTVNLEAYLKRGPQGLAGLLKRDNGESLTGPEAYAKLWEAWLAGFEVLPVCRNHDPKGHCLGHTGKGKQ